MSDGTERQGSSKDRLTPEKLEEYRGLLPMGRFIGVGGDALRALLDEIQACWDERNAPETDTHLCVECGWIKSRPENSAPAAAGPVIAEPSSEGSEPAAVGAGPTPLKARVARKDCKTCLGYGMVGGFVSPDSGYQSDPCPDCSPENGNPQA